MIMIPGRPADPRCNHDEGPTTWWGGLLYIIGVSAFFIADIAFWLWLYFEFFL